MATIEERLSPNGKYSYRVMIRKKGNEISKTFSERVDAELYAYYKEKLIDQINNFEISLEERITLRQILELKLNIINENENRTQRDLTNAMERAIEYFGETKFYNQISLKDWEKAAISIYKTPVYRGAQTDNAKRDMSPKTLRNIFAYISSCVSHVILSPHQ